MRLPLCCLVCGMSHWGRSSLCRQCRRALPWIRLACHRCGQPLRQVSGPIPPSFPADGNRDLLCVPCSLHPGPFRYCRALFHYSRPVDQLLVDFKYQQNLASGMALAGILAQIFRQHYRGPAVPSLLPVPLSRQRLLSRGYNQALEICRVVSKVSGANVLEQVVMRTRHTSAQSNLNSLRARRDNVKGAFRVEDAAPLAAVSGLVLIDDVVTTMSTARAVAHSLSRHYDGPIDLWCLARAGPTLSGVRTDT